MPQLEIYTHSCIIFVGLWDFRLVLKSVRKMAQSRTKQKKINSTSSSAAWWKGQNSGSMKPVLLLGSPWSSGDFSEPPLLLVIAIASFDEEEKYLNGSLAPNHVVSISAFWSRPPKPHTLLRPTCLTAWIACWPRELVTVETRVSPGLLGTCLTFLSCQRELLPL